MFKFRCVSSVMMDTTTVAPRCVDKSIGKVVWSGSVGVGVVVDLMVWFGLHDL